MYSIQKDPPSGAFKLVGHNGQLLMNGDLPHLFATHNSALIHKQKLEQSNPNSAGVSDLYLTNGLPGGIA